MARSDPEQERQRLATLYAGMTEEQLRDISNDAHDLTDDALLTLRSEIARRKLDVAIPVSTAARDKGELRELVTIRRFRDLPETMLAQGLLDSAGIESLLADENIVRMDWFISNGVGGIKLKVYREDAQAAIEVLEQPVPEGFEVEGVGQYQQPHCPECHSLDITFQGLNEPVAYGSAWIGIPLPVHEKSWKCNACGASWEDGETSADQQRAKT